MIAEMFIKQVERTEKRIFITWSVEDVHCVVQGLTDAEAFKVLERVQKEHDASVGISWGTLVDAALNMFPSKARVNI